MGKLDREKGKESIYIEREREIRVFRVLEYKEGKERQERGVRHAKAIEAEFHVCITALILDIAYAIAQMPYSFGMMCLFLLAKSMLL